MSATQNGVTPLKIVPVDTSPDHAFQNEHVQAHGRRDQTDLGHDDNDNAEPDRIISQ